MPTDQTQTVSVVHPSKRFCANLEPDLKCPKCGETTVFVREHETYRDGDEYEAYCDSCDTALQVAAYVTVEFSDPEFVDVD